MNFIWERLGDGVLRCRLPFLDVAVGLVYCRAGAMLIDTGTTLTEARAHRPRLDRRRHRLRQLVVFCGDLVEDWVILEEGEDAVFVPGRGAVVDAAFVRRQQEWLLSRL